VVVIVIVIVVVVVVVVVGVAILRRAPIRPPARVKGEWAPFQPEDSNG